MANIVGSIGLTMTKTLRMHLCTEFFIISVYRSVIICYDKVRFILIIDYERTDTRKYIQRPARCGSQKRGSKDWKINRRDSSGYSYQLI